MLGRLGRRERTADIVSFEIGVGTSDEVGADVRAAAEKRLSDGDELAFRELTDPFRRELQLHCYGSPV